MAKILVVADREGECRATPRALALAQALGLDVDVVAFAYVSLKALKLDAGEQDSLRKRLLLERRQSMQDQIDQQRQPGQKVGLTAVWEKNIDRWIIRQCKAQGYDGVVKCSSGTASLVHSSTDWQLLRECPTPVLLVARKKWQRTKPVLVTLDLQTTLRSKQRLNDKLLRAAKALSQALQVELKIISVIEIPTLLSDLDLIDPMTYVQEAREAAQPVIRKLATAHDLPESAFQCRHGPVEKVIASTAARVRAQMVVMGTVARRGVKARLIGNTAEKVLQHLKTDVLALKP